MKMTYKMPMIVVALIGLLIYGTCDFFANYFQAANLIKFPSSVIIVLALFNAKKNFNLDTSKKIIQIFVFYTIFILLRGSLLGNPPVSRWQELEGIYPIVRELMVNPYAALSYVMMLFVLVPYDPNEFRYLRPIAFICTLLCLINCFVYRDQLFLYDSYGLTNLDNNGEELTIRHLIDSSFIGMGVVILFAFNTYLFKHSLWGYFPIIVLLLYSLAQIAGGGRGGTITSLIYILFSLFFFIQRPKVKGQNTLFKRLFRITIVILVIYVFFYLLTSTDVFDFVLSRIFTSGQLGGELVESNRSYLVNDFIYDMNKNPISWIFGKGINGSYYVRTQGLRANIEWGFLQIILRGGIVHLFLYVLVLLRASYLGFFKSNNLFSKTIAAMCLVRVFQLLPFGLPSVTMEFVLVWHFVRLLNTQSIRGLSDSQIKNLIDNKI